MILIFLNIVLNEAKIKQEVIKYQIGQFILTKNEQFDAEQILHIPQTFLNNTVTQEKSSNLLFQSSYYFDQVVDLQKTQTHQYFIQQDIWILGFRENFYYLAEISTQQTNNKIINQIYEILSSQFQCFSFKFLLIGQVVVDCTDFKNDFYLIFEIKSARQYKVFYQKYISSIRKLHFIPEQNIIIIQNKNSLYFIQYLERNKRYQVFLCHKLLEDSLFMSIEFKNQNIFLYFKHSYQLFMFLQYYQQQEYQLIDHQIFNLTNISNHEYYFDYDGNLLYVKNNSLDQSKSDKSILQFEGQVYNIVEDTQLLVIQTSNQINIVNFRGDDIEKYQINHSFNNDKILVNSKKNEIYVVNSTRLLVYFYGNRISNTIKVDGSLLIQRDQISSPSFIIRKINDSYIVANEQFQFRANGNPSYKQDLDLIFAGGQTNISFQKIDYLNINISYLELLSEFTCNKLHLIRTDSQFQTDNSIFCQQEKFFQQIFCNSYNCFKQIDTITINQNSACFFRSGYGFQYLVQEGLDIQIHYSIQNNTKLIYSQNNDSTLIRFDLDKLIQINHQYKQVEVIKYQHQSQQSQVIKIYPKMIRFDKLFNKMIIIENSIATLFFLENDYYYLTQTFELCEDFLDFIIINRYLVQICKTQILKYTQITNYVYQFSGHIDMYGETINQNSLALNSYHSHFYIIFENEISIFNIKLTLKQSYIKKLILEKFDQVLAVLDYLCIRRQNQVQCFKNTVQLIFDYDEEKFEYNQKVQLNICADNYYDKKCINTIFQIQQTNKKIIVKQKRVQIYLNQTNRKIKINNQYFSGSVHKVEADKFQLEQFKLTISFDLQSQVIEKLFCSYFENYIKFDYNSEIILYDINLNQSEALKTSIKTKDLIKINNYIILLGSRYITEIFQCTDLKNCQKVCNFERNLNIFELVDIQNDTIIIKQKDQLIFYKFEICSFRIIKVIEINCTYQTSQYFDGSTYILVYLDYEGLIHYEYNQIKQVYKLSDLFKNFEQIYYFWHVNKIKLIKNTQVVVFITGMGSYFVQFSQNSEPQIISQLVPFLNQFYHFASFHIQDQKLSIIYQQGDNLILYYFDIEQIYKEAYIDYRYLLKPSNSNIFSTLGVFFFLNDNIYFTDTSTKQLQLFQTSYDHTLIIDEDLQQNTEILITLSNSDQSETFIIELIIEDQYIHLKYICIIVIILVGCFIIKRQIHFYKNRMKI